MSFITFCHCFQNKLLRQLVFVFVGHVCAQVILPPAGGYRAAYWKLRRRGSIDFAVLTVAAVIAFAERAPFLTRERAAELAGELFQRQPTLEHGETLAVALAAWFLRTAKPAGGHPRFLRAALLFNVWMYFGLNFAFFGYPLPWQDWTGRTPNAVLFFIAAAGLTLMALFFHPAERKWAWRPREMARD